MYESTSMVRAVCFVLPSRSATSPASKWARYETYGSRLNVANNSCLRTVQVTFSSAPVRSPSPLRSTYRMFFEPSGSVGSPARSSTSQTRVSAFWPETSKQKRKAEHIEEGYKKRGASKKEAERRAWATVNKSSGGGKKSGSGRGKKTSKASSRKGGKKGGAKSKSR